MIRTPLTLTALALSAFLAACGGSDGPGPKTETTRVHVIGDDQGDSGTFGFKPTIQNSDDLATGFPIFTELVAASLRAPKLCSYYKGVNTSTQFQTNGECTSYAISGSRINFQPTVANNLRALPLVGTIINALAPPATPLDQLLSFLPGLGTILANLPSLPLVGGVVPSVADLLPGVTGANTPLSIPNQFAALATSGVGPKDVVIVVAGTNDASDLATAYIQSSIDQGIAFGTLVGTYGITDSDRRVAGNDYMIKLADNLYSNVSGTLLASGAKKVVVLNLPNIIQTPRLTQARATIDGAEAKVPVIREWVDTYNRRLAANIANDKRVIPVDYLKLLNDAVTDSVALALTNATSPACPSNGNGVLDQLPTYDIKSCTSAQLSANPPAGTTDPNWWKSYAFSDSVHITPYLHNLLARGVNLELVRAGLI